MDYDSYLAKQTEDYLDSISGGEETREYYEKLITLRQDDLYEKESQYFDSLDQYTIITEMFGPSSKDDKVIIEIDNEKVYDDFIKALKTNKIWYKEDRETYL